VTCGDNNKLCRCEAHGGWRVRGEEITGVTSRVGMGARSLEIIYESWRGCRRCTGCKSHVL